MTGRFAVGDLEVGDPVIWIPWADVPIRIILYWAFGTALRLRHECWGAA